jgi:hypothetical protein
VAAGRAAGPPRAQASALAGAARSGRLAGTFFAPTNQAVAALLDAESLKLSAITGNGSLASQARPPAPAPSQGAQTRRHGRHRARPAALHVHCCAPGSQRQ